MSSIEKMVSVPRELAEVAGRALSSNGYDLQARDLEAALSLQPQGEPVGTLLIDEYFDNREAGEVDVQLDAKVCEQLAEKFPGQSLPLYIHADPGEVERLRAEIKRLREAAEMAARSGAPNFHEKTREISKLRAQLEETENDRKRLRDNNVELTSVAMGYQRQLAERDALLREGSSLMPLGTRKRADWVLAVQAALSTSAEPSAPTVHPINMKTIMQAYEQVDHKALLHGTSNWCAAMATALRGVLHAEPSAPVERPSRCCCPPPGYSGLWGAGLCPEHFGLAALTTRAALERKP